MRHYTAQKKFLRNIIQSRNYKMLYNSDITKIFYNQEAILNYASKRKRNVNSSKSRSLRSRSIQHQ